MDYNIFYKKGPVKRSEITDLGQWDIFISAYNQSERVNTLFEEIIAENKLWIVHPEYHFTADEIPRNGKEIFTTHSPVPESQFISDLFNFLEEKKITKNDLKNNRLCIDSTGFLRPHLMYLILYLYRVIKFEKFDIIYSEPESYIKAEKTKFSIGAIENVRFVEGFSSILDRNSNRDLLIIGSGYDQELLAEVVEDKLHAKKIQIVGFPSLQPDMYQQCRLKTHGVDAIGEEKEPFFAPANDPFVTASVISEIVNREDSTTPISNLYLSPLGTKPQTIGFVLFFLGEMLKNKRPGGIIFPVRESYSKETSKGFSRAWSYHIEFPIQ